VQDTEVLLLLEELLLRFFGHGCHAYAFENRLIAAMTGCVHVPTGRYCCCHVRIVVFIVCVAGVCGQIIRNPRKLDWLSQRTGKSSIFIGEAKQVATLASFMIDSWFQLRS
jgi:hypothetical protein